MKKRLGVWLFCVVMAHAGCASAPDTVIKAKPVYGKEAKLVADVLRQAHFRKMPFNDSLSSVVFDRYFKELDNNKIYFLSSDIEQFEKYRFQLDDLTREGNVNVAFDIYKVFQGRNRARLQQVIDQLVKKEFDYTSDEYYETDRDKAVWASTNLVLDDEWRKMVKSQALSLKLTGKKQDEITDLLRKRYERLLRSYQQLNSEDVFSMYLNCITEAYDPHTNYLSPKATDLFKQQMSLSLEGIGARLQVDNDYTKVVEIVAGGPADKSGLLHPNDLITGVAQGVEGEMVDVTGWRIDDVVKLIKGPKGTMVRLQVLPASTGVSGPATTISLVRDKVKLEDQAAKKQVITYNQNGKTMKMGVIVLPGFYQDFDEARKGNPNYRSTTRDVRRLIGELQAEGVTGIVMDLRNNGGGSLAEAISLTGLFIKDGPVVQVRDSRSRVDVFADDDPKVVYTGPLVVLTNRFSASASEIFAGAIQDYHRGLIVGESTFGKGTVQSVIDLSPYVNDPDKVGELKYTFQKFYRVTGSSTQHKGVTPDIQLPSALKPEQFGESASPNALPWDVIQRAEFQRVSDIDDKLLASLKKNYAERLKSDAVLKRYEGEVAEMRKNLEETRISLNEAKRRQEIDEAEKKKKTNEPLDTKITSKEGIQNEDLSKLKDEYLREGLLLLSDIITKRIG